MSAKWKQQILVDFPELPLARRVRFVEQYSLPEYDADILTSERGLSDYFETAVASFGGEAKTFSNWMMNSTPFMPGMLRSVTMQSNASRWMAWRASAALE